MGGEEDFFFLRSLIEFEAAHAPPCPIKERLNIESFPRQAPAEKSKSAHPRGGRS